MILDIFLAFIVVLLIFISTFLVWTWQKVSIFLTWNTRYTGADYEQAVTTPKIKRSAEPPTRTKQQGRAIKPIDDLVDLSDLPFEDAYEAVAKEGE